MLSKKQINDKYLERMEDCEDYGDTEIGHELADNIILEILKDLGLEEIAESFEAVDKWYS